MRHFFFIPEKGLEEKVARRLQDEVHKADLRVEATVYPALETPTEKKSPYKSDSLFISLAELLMTYSRFRHLLLPRKQTEEKKALVYLGNKLINLFLLHLLTRKKIIWIRVSQELKEKRISFFQRLIILKSAEVILTDDQKINRHYRQNLLPSYFVGNVLADLCPSSSFEFLHGKNPILAFFPKTDEFEKGFLAYLDLAEKLWPSNQKYYFLLVIPKGVSIKKVKEIAEKEGWLYCRSFEGDIIEGYLWKQSLYINLTRFYSEALEQAELVLSNDPIRIIQAASIGKKILYTSHKAPEELIQILNNQVFFFEYCHSMWDRFGARGGLKRLVAYLLWGVVEDPRFNQYLSKKGVGS
ncbi:MAG: hypothetical protein J7J32_02330 [Candidatus Atribacteria bacterium]|nr:hypothetical protein [Candidatus Atribacteria bacterium]MCD6350407.1 hypothetical protein [Candidatus Atribacteria bacterium]